MHVPDWLVSMVYKCLEKKPESRFATGVELHEYAALNGSKSSNTSEAPNQQVSAFVTENELLVKERNQLQTKIEIYQQQVETKDREIQELKALVSANANRVAEPAAVYAEDPYVNRGVSKSAFITVLILAIGLAAFAAYSFFRNNGTQTTAQVSDSTQSIIDSLVQADTANQSNDVAIEEKKEQAKDTARTQVAEPAATQTDDDDDVEEAAADTSKPQVKEPQQEEQKPEPRGSGKYRVISKAFFHDQPSEATRRKAFISHWNNAVLTPLGQTADFIYVEFTNHLGQTSKGYLRKADLKLID
jgi:serine/threonine-protein kinase